MLHVIIESVQCRRVKTQGLRRENLFNILTAAATSAVLDVVVAFEYTSPTRRAFDAGNDATR